MPVSLQPEDIAWVSEQTNRAALFVANSYPDLSLLWDYLRKSEEKAIRGDFEPAGEDGSGNAEFGFALHAMRHLVAPQSTHLFKELGMPDSMSRIDTGKLFTPFYGVPLQKVTSHGSLNLEMPFANLDIGWAMSTIAEVLRKAGIIPTHPFKNTPAAIEGLDEKDDLTIAIIGDWGTGHWADGACDCPAKLVAQAIRNMNPQPDILLHLGDVYYAGRPAEETNRFLLDFPAIASGLHFTLNSNHEMYSGANGYFGKALSHYSFQAQQSSSFFSIKYKNYRLVGLDTAYFDTSLMIGKGAISSSANQSQVEFLQNLGLKANEKLIIFTHHNCLPYEGTSVEPLYAEVQKALSRNPDYWYYGHIHAGIVYGDGWANENPAYKCPSGNYPGIRCVGHSAIPYGRGCLTNDEKTVRHFASTPYKANTCRAADCRVLNGFATIRLTNKGIEEKMYEVDANGLGSISWQI